MARKSSTALVTEFLKYCQVHRGRRPQTLYGYRKGYSNLLVALGRTHVCDASVEDLRTYVSRQTRRGEPSPATKKRRVAELRVLYRWLHQEGYLPTNPALRLEAPTVDNENPNPIRDDVWRTLWASDLCDSDRVAFGLGLFCGLRRFEVTGLSPGHFVDVPKAILAAVVRKGGKARNMPWSSCVRYFAQRRPDLIGGDAKTFIAPLERLRAARPAEVALLDWNERLEAERGHLRKHARPDGFIDPFLFNRRLSRALEAAGLPRDAATPHMLRHGFCTFLLNAGVPLLDVSRLAGHSSVAITQRYLKSLEDPLEALLDDEDDDRGGEDPSRFGPWAS